MIFSLKRFEYDVNIQRRNKLNDFLEFPQKLNLLEFSTDTELREKAYY